MAYFTPALDLKLDVSDQSAAGLLAQVGHHIVRATAKHGGRLFKADGGMARIRAFLPSTDGRHAYLDQDLSSAIVRIGLGWPDQVATSGTAPLAPVPAQTSGVLIAGQRYLVAAFVAGDSFLNVGATLNATGNIFTASGTTPTVWTNGSSLLQLTADYDVTGSAAAMQAALNAAAGIAAKGGVTVVKLQAGHYEVTFSGEYGPQAPIAGPIAGGMIPQSVVSVSRIQPGVAASPGPGLHEVQLIRFLALPYIFAQLSDPFPAAAAFVEVIQPATATLPSTRRLSIDPPAYDGHIHLLVNGSPVAMPFDASAAHAQFLAGARVSVKKFSATQWDFSGLDPAQDVSLSVSSTASLRVPRGVTGPVGINTVALLRAFSATTARFLKLPLHVTIQWPGQQPQTVYLSPYNDLVEIERGVIDISSIAPPIATGLQFVASHLTTLPWDITNTVTALRGGPASLESVATDELTFDYTLIFYVGAALNVWRWVAGIADPTDLEGQVAALDSVLGHWQKAGL